MNDKNKALDFCDKIQGLLPLIPNDPVAALEVLGILAALRCLIERLADAGTVLREPNA